MYIALRIEEWDLVRLGVRRKEMKIGEVSSAVSYQGQGSSVKAAPAPAVQKDSAIVDFTAAAKEAKADSENRSFSANPEKEEAEKNPAQQATSSLKEAVEKINSANGNAEAVFGIHEGTNRVTIKMVDKETKEVIKEFPADKTLDLIAKAWELAGIMVDEKR
jgi:flagellar protein FlaG